MLSLLGTVPPPRPPALLDRWLGEGWRLLERHEALVAASPPAALGALAGLRLHDLRPVRILFALRGLRLAPDATLRRFFSDPPFVLLDEDPGREIVTGAALPPRGAGGRRVPRTPAEVRALLPAASWAVAATFRADPREEGTLLWTETWVRTRGAAAGVAFGLYWLAIGGFSAWIRRLMLAAAKAAAEAGRGG